MGLLYRRRWGREIGVVTVAKPQERPLTSGLAGGAQFGVFRVGMDGAKKAGLE
jgi:hypothetical protein